MSDLLEETETLIAGSPATILKEPPSDTTRPTTKVGNVVAHSLVDNHTVEVFLLASYFKVFILLFPKAYQLKLYRHVMSICECCGLLKANIQNLWLL